MASDYKFVLDNGRTYYVCAESRKEAQELFCKEHGVSKEFLKEHCIIRNLGRINNDE